MTPHRGESTMSEAVKLAKVIVDGEEFMLPAGANLLGELLKLGRIEAPNYGVNGEHTGGVVEAEGESGEKGYTYLKYPDQRDQGEHYVPHYCWHPGLSVSGNCRMCFVNITQEMRGQKMTMPATACTNVVRDGIEVDTKSEAVHKIQNGVQEFLLINHPLDCPECDKSGECRLQDYAFDFGRDYTRFEEKKQASHIKQLGPTIDFFGTRCIQCSRCIRFSDEISGMSELAFVNRGDRTTIDTFPGEPIDNDIDLNVVQVCPVGALKNHDFLYQARVWSLDENPSVCNLCSRGCAVRYDSLKGGVKRVMAEENKEVNGWWICNGARTNYHWINRADRLQQPRTKEDEFAGWNSSYVSLSERLKSHLDKGADSLAVVVSAAQTVEELFLMKRLFSEGLSAKNIAAIAREDEEPKQEFKNFKRSADKNPNRKGVELVFGIDDCEASIKTLVEKIKKGAIKTLFIVNNHWDGYVPQALVDVLDKVEFKGGISLFNDDVSKKLDFALAGQTHAEKDGSFVNEDWRLQAFRKAVDDVAGLPDTEILQELLERVAPAAEASTTNVLSAQGIFKQAAENIPQLSGYTHKRLRELSGVALM